MEYEKQFQFLQQKFETGKLGHAYILSAGNVDSLKTFITDFAKLINCVFPDVLTVKSADSKSSVANEKDMLEIAVEQIRDTQNFLAYKSYNGGYKMVVVENAERMSLEAQNCFLKSLEEPSGQTVIFLLSSNPEMMLTTIASRCQMMKFVGGHASASMPPELAYVLNGDLAEKFTYAKNANLEGENFENILKALQNYFRNKDIVGHGAILKSILKLERQAKFSNINKKLALEVLLLNI